MLKKLRWQILVVFLALVVVGILLLIQKPGVSSPVSPQPAIGGIYTEALVGSFGRLNPLLDRNNSADRDVDRLLFDGLIRFDYNGIPRPNLAESWGISQDGTIYNFTLRSNATWHDGQPVTTDDVLYTLDLMRTQYSAYPEDIRSMWEEIQVIRLDDKSIKFILPEPFSPFLDFLTFGVVPKHLFQLIAPDQIVNDPINLAPVGSGPYRFDQLIVEDGKITGVVLSLNENYHGQKPLILQIVFRYYRTSAEALQAYQDGEVIGISQIDGGSLSDAMLEENLGFYTTRLPRLSMVLFNLDNPDVPFLQEKEVRLALAHGLNRQYMVDSFLQGQAVLADTVIMPGTWAYYDGVDKVAFDVDVAQSMLRDAGYDLTATGPIREKEGQALAFTLIHQDDDLHARLAESIQADWANLGVAVSLQAVSFEDLVNTYLGQRNYQAALVDLDMGASPDPDPYPFWHQSEVTGGQNYSQWDNRTASEYLEQARVLTDLNVRARLYRNFQVIFSREMPALPLYYPVYTYAVDARVMGVQIAPLFNTSDRFFNIHEWYLVTGRLLDETPTPIVSP